MRSLARLSVLLLLAAPVLAQAPIEPAKLPPQTLLYLSSSGVKLQPGVAQKNPLLSLWNDPQFAPVRAAVFGGATQGVAKDSDLKVTILHQQQMTAADDQKFLPLLENPFVFGVILGSGNSASGSPSATRIFLVFDATGKEALARAFLTEADTHGTEKAQVAPTTIGTVPAERVTRKGNTSYRAFLDQRLVIASDATLFENLVQSLAKGSAPPAALGESNAFVEAQKALPPGSTLQFFLRVPDLAALAGAKAGPKAAQVQAILRGLRVEAFHAICLSVDLNGPETRFRGAILGDAGAGTLFDVEPDGSAPLASLGLAPATAISYSASRFDLPALYRFLRSALQTSLPPEQSSAVEMVEGLAAMKLGMPLPEALQVFSGEYASFSMNEDLDARGDVHVIAITDKAAALKLVHALAALASDHVSISNERDDAGTTLLEMSVGKQGAAAGARFPIALAVTPEFLLFSGREDTLRALLADKQAGSLRLAATPGFLKARSRFPERVNGLSYADLSRVNWEAALNRVIQQWTTPKGKTGEAKFLELIPPGLLKNHLHTVAGASWKDAHGIHFDGWIE